MKYFAKNSEETIKFGLILSKHLQGGDVILARGNLGAGKTLVAQTIGKELGVNQKINSPTFNIVKSYKAKNGYFNHIDAYRLEDSNNIDIGLDELIYSDDITFIEWPDYIKQFLPPKKYELLISYKDDGREIELTGSKEYENIINRIEEELK